MVVGIITVESLLKETPINLSIKEKFCGPYRTTILPLKEDNLSITVKLHLVEEVPLYFNNFTTVQLTYADILVSFF